MRRAQWPVVLLILLEMSMFSNSTLCEKCEDPVPPDQVLTRGKKVCHKVCFNVYKCHNDKLKDKKRALWWAQQNAEAKHAWYRKHRLAREQGRKVRYDEHTLEESTTHSVHEGKDDIWDCVPWTEYVKDLLKAGLEQDDIAEKWNRDLMDEDIPKEYRNGQPLVGIYRGIQIRQGTKQSTTSTLKRSRAICGEDGEEEVRLSRMRVQAQASALAAAVLSSTMDLEQPESAIDPTMHASRKTTTVLSTIEADLLKDIEAVRKQQCMGDALDDEDDQAIAEFMSEFAEKHGSKRNFAEYMTAMVNFVSSKMLRANNQMESLKEQTKSATERLALVRDKMAADPQACVDSLKLNLDKVVDSGLAKATGFKRDFSLERLNQCKSLGDLDIFRSNCKDAEGKLLSAKLSSENIGEARGVLRKVMKQVETFEKDTMEGEQKAAQLAATGGCGDGVSAEDLPANMKGIRDLIAVLPNLGTSMNFDDFGGVTKVCMQPYMHEHRACVLLT